jgi:hypothetical protein
VAVSERESICLPVLGASVRVLTSSLEEDTEHLVDDCRLDGCTGTAVSLDVSVVLRRRPLRSFFSTRTPASASEARWGSTSS